VIKRISASHFRSLATIDLELGAITILVGTNAAGKSNAIDAFRFLRDCIVFGLDDAVNNRGGLNLIRQYSPTRPYTLKLAIEYDCLIEDKNYPAEYSISIAGSNDNPVIEEERAKVYRFEPDFSSDDDEFVEERTWNVSEVSFRRDKQGQCYLDEKKAKSSKFSSDSLAFSSLFASGFHRFDEDAFCLYEAGIKALSEIRFTSIYPNTLRAPTRPDPDKRLKEDCSNWASVIKAMRQTEKGRKAWGRIKEFMSIVLPGFEEITVRTVGGHLSPQFKVKDLKSDRSHFLDPLQLSDGTLRLMGLFLALYQEPKPLLLALEEPELTVHPGLLKLLSEAIHEVSSQTQLLITSHSPHLLDHFSVDDIRVVDMSEDGCTHIGKVKGEQRETVQEKLMAISEIMAFDGLVKEG